MAAWLRLINIDQFEELLAFLKYVRVGLLADFTFKFLPVVRGDILSVLFHMSLCFKPILEATVVDIADSASTLAGQN